MLHAPFSAGTTPPPVSAVKNSKLICASQLLACKPCSADNGCFAWAQAESVRKTEEERMKREAKEALLRANKERLDRLQAAWKEDQQLKEVPKPRSFCLYKQYSVDRCLWLPSGHDLKGSVTGSSSVCMPDSSSLFAGSAGHAYSFLTLHSKR